MRIGAETVAVVTGAASGIGRAVAAALAARGAAVALVDRDADGLAGTQAALGARTSLHVVDVADRAAMGALPAAVVAAHGAVHLLVNNAGVAIAGRFEDVTLDDFDWIVGVNFWGTVHACHAFLPHLRGAPASHVVNVLSDFALFGFPTKSHYCATKFAVRGFSEALRAELHGSTVGLTCVYPGPVATRIFATQRVVDERKRALEADFVRRRALPAETVAARIVAGVERGAARVLIGKETHAIDAAARLAPATTQRLVAMAARRVPFV
jgi:short-subunit dehydrogenase